MILTSTRRRLSLLCVVAALTGTVATPANADCITAGVWVHVGTTKRTVVPDGTCVAPTPLPTGITYTEYTGEPSTAGVGYSVSVPLIRAEP